MLQNILLAVSLFIALIFSPKLISGDDYPAGLVIVWAVAITIFVCTVLNIMGKFPV